MGEKLGDGLAEKVGRRLADGLVEGLGENRARILALIKHDPSVSIPKLAETIGISTTAIENNIKYLKTKGLLRRSGSAKGGHWIMPT